MKTLSYDTWRELLNRSGEGNPLQARVQCPSCGNIATPQEFKDAGAHAGRAFQECIGRLIECPESSESPPCRSTAFGLLGVGDEGTRVILFNGGTMDVFPIVDPEAIEGAETG